MPIPDYGVDLSCVTDLDPVLRTVTGKTLLAQAIVRRLTTPRGMLIDDPNYGLDVREWLSMEMTPIVLARLRAAVRSELEKDERVSSVNVDTTFTNGVLTMNLFINANEDDPLSLVLAVTDVTVTILSVE